ncbi:hypothetical protein CLP36_01600 [Vibrio cholerae]|nr:hypothetical protein [Vibrio cholerae]EGR0588801.1 hypothetical protein [Vibrio cholerae]EGR1136604.1 hypothetical protein [Vibrio cholerae]EGR5484190.1 hypothetical protein [Vibrio cholerae]TXY98703.1 hypothetical protein FXE61_16200 [Vibrio cholerae]
MCSLQHRLPMLIVMNLLAAYLQFQLDSVCFMLDLLHFFINRLNFLLIPSLNLSLCWGLFLLRNNSPIYIKFRTFIVFKSHPSFCFYSTHFK